MSKRDQRGAAGRGDVRNNDEAASLQDALAHHQAGRLVEAELLYRRVLDADPENTEALHLLGVAALQAGRPTEAVDLIGEAARRQPENPQILNNLGEAYRALSRLDEAAECYRRAIALDARDPAAHNNLGNAMAAEGRLDAAEASYRRALELQPDDPEILVNLAGVLKEEGKPDDAVAILNRVLTIEPRMAQAHCDLGRLLKDANQLVDAERSLRRAIALSPDFTDAYCNLGSLLMALDRLDDAESAYKRALEIEPDKVEALANLAAHYESTNRLEEADDMLARGLAADPDDPRLRLTAAKLDRYRHGSDVGISRLAIVDRSKLDPDMAMEVSFEMGRLHDREGDAAKAISYFEDGNALLRQLGETRGIDARRYLDELDALSEFFQPGEIAASIKNNESSDPRAPIFLIGFPRSGTTLLEMILGSHPSLQVMGERPAFAAVKRELAAMPDGFPRTLANLPATEVRRLRSVYEAVVDRYMTRDPKRLLIDKAPLLTPEVGPILSIFPNARFIFAVRHPCDVCLSCFMQAFENSDHNANFFTLADTANLYAKTMDLWRQYLKVLSVDFHAVRYEDLVENMPDEVSRLLGFLGLPWNDAVLQYAEHAKQQSKILTPSSHQVTEPIYRRSKFRWHRYRSQFQPVMATLRPHIDYFGYSETEE